MNNHNKIKLINSIRKEIEVPDNSDNEFFSREEAEKIAIRVNPDFDTSKVSVENILPEAIEGWFKQKTIGNHPNLKNANLILNLLQCELENDGIIPEVTQGDRLSIREAMSHYGMEDPETDTDQRQAEIWLRAEELGLDVELHVNYDFNSQLCTRADKYYSQAQSRVGAEKAEKINNLFQRFYTAGEKQKRPSAGVIIDGVLYVGSGNHRAFTHRLAQKQGYNSIGSVLVYGNNSDEKTKLRFLLDMGKTSNKDTGDQTTEETMQDIAHQVKNDFNFLLKWEEGYDSFTEEQKISWADEWLKANKMKYQPDGMKAIRTKIANMAFSSNISQSIPLPDEDEHSSIWNKFFPDDLWHPSSQTSVIQKVQTSNESNLQKNIFLIWKHDSTGKRVPKRMWLLARCGSTVDTTITSIERVKKDRERMIKFLTAENNNPKMRSASFPIYDKVVFVKQVQGFEEEAYVWNVRAKNFDKVEETS